MSFLLNAAALIPLETRIRIIDEYYPGARSGNSTHQTNLFNLYIQYIAPKNHGLTLQCGTCLSTILSNWNTIITHWKL
jgi:hypothetical protein